MVTRKNGVLVEHVLKNAARMDKRERIDSWTECGAHDVESLPMTAPGGSGPLPYCSRCWTLFGREGIPYNRPLWPGGYSL